MALVHFFAGVFGQAKTLTLTPFLKGGFAVAAMWVGENRLSAALPLGSQPLMHSCQPIDFVQRADQRFAEFCADGGSRCGVAAGFGAYGPPALDLNVGAQLRQPTITHQLGPEAGAIAHGHVGIGGGNEFTGCQPQHCISEKLQLLVMRIQTTGGVGECLLQQGNSTLFQ